MDEKDNRLLTKSSHVSLKSKKARANMNRYLFDIMGNIILVIKYKQKSFKNIKDSPIFYSSMLKIKINVKKIFYYNYIKNKMKI
jgi:hypothetical protein